MKKMKKLIFAALAIVLTMGAVILVRQMQSTARDSNNATLASKLREQLHIWFEEKNEYPTSLEQVWNQSAMRDYCVKYSIPDERRMIFTYTTHSNWYELSFTNFGALQTQIASNGVVIR
jgi:hypothetical protein